MQFRIADTFTDSLAKLTGQEQKGVKTTAFDLQLNPANPGMQFHRLDRARDPNFWSLRVTRDIRIIVHKTSDNLLLCYVDHHDKAYDWAARRRLETHPKTGAAQLVEIRETVKEITIPKYVEVEQPAPPMPKLFASLSDDDLLSYGVPHEWLEDVQEATEDSLFGIADHLPVEAAEALLELATGGKPELATAVVTEDPFDHPDAQRRFRLMTDSEELKRALEYPWEKWAVFLHPDQQAIVDRKFNGPARVAGSAGTGKTVVALHRAVHLAEKYPNAKVLVTTFTEALADVLRAKIESLIDGQPEIIERIEVADLDAVGKRLFLNTNVKAEIANADTIKEVLSSVAERVGKGKFTDQFVWMEFHDVVDAWQLSTWENYRDVQRLGRKTRLGETGRKQLWEIFTEFRSELDGRNLITNAGMFAKATEHAQTQSSPVFDFIVVDEAQDLSVSQLRFLGAMGKNEPEGLFFAGDLGQRIFEPPFSWKSLGVDIRGRSKTLRINYRTSHQIRSQAERLLPPELADVDGNAEKRTGTVSLFNGPPPAIQIFDGQKEESSAVSKWVKQTLDAGISPQEIGIFVRSPAQFDRAKTAIGNAGAKCNTIEDRVNFQSDQVNLMTMHLAKGLEFRAVAVMACDDEIIPLQSRIESVADASDLKEVYSTERHLLYVACTRARDQLFVTGVEPASEFLDDLDYQAKDYE